MRITNLAIRYRPTVAVLTVMLVLGGLVSYVTIPKESFPSIEIPTIIVTTLYFGASPDDVESLITRPIEEEIASIKGIAEMRSTSGQGVSTVMVEFSPDVSMDLAFQRVRDKVQLAKPEMPSDIEEPAVYEVDVEDIPMMSINLAGPYSLARLKDVADNLADDVETIPEVLEVEIVGALEREVKVDVDLAALQGYGLAFQDVIDKINNENINIPGGTIQVDRRNYLVRLDESFVDIETELANLVVNSPNSRPVYLRDVAHIDFGYKEQATYARLAVFQEDVDGQTVRRSQSEAYPVVTLNIKKRSGANILITADKVRAVVDDFVFLPGTEVATTGDQSEQVQIIVDDLENNIISGLIFVVLVLLFFLGVRTATLVGIAIPLSMFLTFIVFQTLGQELNFVILFSLIIALGMLVDNAVVIVENIYRYRELGHSRFDAARKGTQEVGSAVVASTATTVAVFIPMLFWPGITGEFMGYMPLTLIITLLCSLFVAVIINPVITGYFVRLDSESAPARSRMARQFGILTLVVAAIMIGLANWRTLLVLAVTIPLFVVLLRTLFSQISARFVRTGLPRLIRRYRVFLRIMLKRDYTVHEAPFARKGLWRATGVCALVGALAIGNVMGNPGLSSQSPPGMFLFAFGGLLSLLVTPVLAFIAICRTRNPYLRNIAAIGSMSVGFLLLIVGGILSGYTNAAASAVLLVPGMILMAFGILGVLAHSMEIVYLGAWRSVRGGIAFLVISGVVLTLMVLTRGVEAQTFIILLLLPAGIAGVGLLGAVLNRQRRANWLLTDNRAKLLVGTVGGFVAILGLFAAAPTGVEFFPDTDPNIVTVGLETPLGTHVHETNRVTDVANGRINTLLDQNNQDRDNVKNMLITVGSGGGGNPLMAGGPSNPETSLIQLNMVDYGERRESTRQTLQRLRQQLQGIPGVQTVIDRDQVGPPVAPPVNIEVAGDEFEVITDLTQQIMVLLQDAALTGVIPGLVDLADDLDVGRPELEVRINRENAARAGLDSRQISNTVRSAISGVTASKYRTGDDEYDITVRLGEQERSSVESVEQLTVVDQGRQIPMSSLANFEIGEGLGSITRLDQSRVATITGDVAPGYNGAAVLGQVQQYLAEFQANMPPGYSLSYTGENEEQAEAFGFLGTALGIGVAAIFMILIAQFNSVFVPVIIMIAVGLGLIGVLFGLILTRTAFGLMTFIGVISLAGIVVNNNIVLIDYIRQLRDRGLGKAEAIIEGGATRLRPVVLTVLTTIIGLVPLTFGLNIDFVGLLNELQPNIQFGSENTQFWGAMGTAIISGLTFATFLTLVIVPVMYSSFDSLHTHLTRAFRSAEAE